MIFNTLRLKLTMGFVPLLAIVIGLGLWAIVMFYGLGGNIDVVLRENYRSVLAAERMKEALERMDSGVMFAISGRNEMARTQFDKFKPEFERQLRVEQGNVTLPGEQQLVDDLAADFEVYKKLADQFFGLQPQTPEARADLYFSQLLPRFERIKGLADDILLLNQRNMESTDRTARLNAASSIRLMIVALLVASALAVVSAGVLTRLILGPISAVTMAARAVARGDLDQVVPAHTRDELGELGQAFNVMARTIREFREAGSAKLLRAQRTAQATIDSFPDPVIVVDPRGGVERANPAAQRLMHAIPATNGGALPWIAPAPLKPHLEAVLAGQGDYLPLSLDEAIFQRDRGHDRYFLPRVLRIRSDSGELLGAAVVLTDVTKFRLVDQLKNDMISTVSHELKTPLTSLQMVVHLLLEETVGPLTTKQVELLLAARQDCDRLLGMINDLLDLARIEQGRVALETENVNAGELVQAACERFTAHAEDSGVRLYCQVDARLPAVMVDKERIEHVFDNLISNALRHTDRGGRITLGAKAAAESVKFSIEDTGHGIPAEHLSRIFDRFFRAPNSKRPGGAGLGLAIVREIITAHGGQIDVRSQVGAGTVFTFTLPESGSVRPGADTVITREFPAPSIQETA
jgi:two-component system, NtrC family, sensor histidine kinase KinB